MLLIVASVALRSASPSLCTAVPSYATWLLGYLATWLLGCLATWRLGDLTSWLLGFLASWLLVSWLLGFFLFYVSFGLLPSYAATRLRGYAATLSDNPTVNYARVMLTTRHCHCRWRVIALVGTVVAPHGATAAVGTAVAPHGNTECCV